MSLKISFLIPLYNDEKYIERSITSIEEQDYTNIEIVVVNDGSTDSSLSICERLKDKYGNIKIFTTKNLGVCSARNLAVRKATGSYVLFCDSDDFFEEGAISEIVEVIEDTGADLVTFDYKNVYESGRVRDRFKNDGKIDEYTNAEALNEYILGNENFSMVLWRRAYRAELIKSVKFTDNMLPEDYHTATDYYYLAKKVVHIRKSYYNYFTKTSSGLTIRNSLDSDMQNYTIKKEVFEKQIQIVDDESIKKVIKDKYMKSLLTIYASIYRKQDSDKKKDCLKLIDSEICKSITGDFSRATKVALFAYTKIKSYFQLLCVKLLIER